MGRQAIFSSDENLSHFQCTKNVSAPTITGSSCPDYPESLSYKAWTFHSLHSKILDSKELCKMALDISTAVGGSLSSDDHVNVSNHILRLPAMIFGKDVLSAEFCGRTSSSDGAITLHTEDQNNGSSTISINALDALSCWAAQHTEENKSITPLNIVRVPCAKSWNERSLIPADSTDKSTTTSSCEGKAETSVPSRNIWDWTFGSDYCCSLTSEGSETVSGRAVSRGSSILPNSELSVATSLSEIKMHLWQKCDVSGIDFNLLRMQNVPILFFDEILLYQDDLEDCGEVTFDAKLRVMPSCWFILSRFFVRVDGAIVRTRDTRLFHRFGDKKVHMEVTWHEKDLSIEGADSLTNAVLCNPAACAEKLPIVNEQEGIHRFYSYDLF